jgi:hypothetical protein
MFTQIEKKVGKTNCNFNGELYNFDFDFTKKKKRRKRIRRR